MIEAFTSSNARIRVPILGQEWQLEEDQTQVEAITTVRSRLVVPGQFALLTAQDILQSPAEVRSAESWAREVFSARYAHKYEAVKLGYLETLRLNGRDWLEVSWELIIHARLAPLAKLERIHCSNNHLLVVSAEASAKDLRRYWPEVTNWLEGVHFRALEKKAES